MTKLGYATFGASIVRTQIKVSVCINGIFLALDAAVEAVRRFCQPAMFHGTGTVFDVGPTGSAFFFRYRGKNFGLCTWHQFGSKNASFPPEAFTLAPEMHQGKTIGFPPNETIQANFTGPDHENLSDIFLARWDNSQGNHSLRQHFLEVDLENSLSNVMPQSIILVVAIGFPTEAMDTEFLLDDEDIPTAVSMKIRYVKLYLELATSENRDTQNRHPLVVHSKYPCELKDPDGLSGAPVFFVYLDSSHQAQFGFAGIITHSNGQRFMIYGADKIRLILDRYMQDND